MENGNILGKFKGKLLITDNLLGINVYQKLSELEMTLEIF